MLKTLKNIFESKNQETNTNESDNLELLCGLMIEAAKTDGILDNVEISKIKSILINTFEENSNEVESILNKAIENIDFDKSLHFYTSRINKTFSDEKKILLLETLWEIILSDGEVHDYESNLIRRLSGLLYISDVNSGNARKRALNKTSSLK